MTRQLSRLPEFQRLLLDWFSTNGRRFPWRRSRDPYKILVAEVLLQKTDSTKVLPVYRRLVKKHPNVRSLAGARLLSLKRLIRPIGLHYRARRLQMMARDIVEGYGGRVPRTAPELLRLPGVGAYIANAVLAVAFLEPVPMVDTNVVRVMKRAFNMRSRMTRERADRRLWASVAATIPRARARDYSLALLDLGGLVCTARKPNCPDCPVSHPCSYYRRIHPRHRARRGGSLSE
jgi:A/G-specific adenine glycosylase